MRLLHVLIAEPAGGEVEKMHLTYFLCSCKSIIFQFLKVNAKRMMSIGAVSQGRPVWGLFLKLNLSRSGITFCLSLVNKD